MLCFVLTLTIVLPAFTVAQDVNENQTKIGCDMPGVISAGDKFFECFNETVNHSINKNYSTCNTLDQDLKAYMQVANESCYNETKSNVDAGNFLDLVKFSIRNGEFADFVHNGGVECIVWTKTKMSKCVMEEVLPRAEPSEKSHLLKYDTLWRMSTFRIDEDSCNKAMTIKRCVQEDLWDICQNETVVLYVNSLFEFMLSRCLRRDPEWNQQNEVQESPQGPKFCSNHTTHALLGILLALAILSIFYACVRDCRAPRGRWKVLNERISMSMINRRRRSLVENDASQAQRESCKATDRLKLCTLQAMRDEGYYKCHYENHNVLYVGSLFEYILERCARLYTGGNAPVPTLISPNTIDKSTCVTHASLGVLLVLAILSIIYVFVCKCQRAQWKAFNERATMSMTNRWRSLVNN